MIVHCCHCRSCQRESGSSYVVNGLIESDRVDLVRGVPEIVHTPTASGQGQKIARCSTCWVALWSHYAYAGIGDMVRFVRMCTLDQPDAVPPDVHIYIESKQNWVQIPKDTPSYTRFYSAKALWSPASLERRALLFAKSS